MNIAKLTSLLVRTKVDVLFSLLSGKHSNESSKVVEESDQFHRWDGIVFSDKTTYLTLILLHEKTLFVKLAQPSILLYLFVPK
jgi:hypothetical protein